MEEKLIQKFLHQVNIEVDVHQGAGEDKETKVSFDLSKMFHSIFPTHKHNKFPCFRCKPFANLSIKPVKVKVTKLFLNEAKTAAWNAAYSHVKSQELLYQSHYINLLCNSFVFLNYFSALNCKLQSPARQNCLNET